MILMLMDSRGVEGRRSTTPELPDPIALVNIPPGGTATGNVLMEASESDNDLKFVYALADMSFSNESVVIGL